MIYRTLSKLINCCSLIVNPFIFDAPHHPIDMFCNNALRQEKHHMFITTSCHILKRGDNNFLTKVKRFQMNFSCKRSQLFMKTVIAILASSQFTSILPCPSGGRRNLPGFMNVKIFRPKPPARFLALLFLSRSTHAFGISLDITTNKSRQSSQQSEQVSGAYG